MRGLKTSIAIFALLYTVQQIQGEFTREWNHDSYFGFPLKLDDRLIYINAEEREIIQLNITSSEGNSPSCTAQIDPKYILGGYRNAKILGNGKIILWSKWQLMVRWFLVVDPRDCSHKIIMRDNETDVLPMFVSELMFGAVVPYQDTFDFFDWKMQFCAPCRYNDEGEKIDAPHSLPLDPYDEGMSTKWMLFADTLDEKDASKGYIHAYKFKNHSTVLRVMDSEFKTLKERFTQRLIFSYSVANGNISVCYEPLGRFTKREAKRTITCEMLDAELKPKFAVSVQKINAFQFVRPPKIHNLPDGGAIVTTAVNIVNEKNGEFDRINVYIQRIKADGKLGEKLEFGTTFNRCDNWFEIHDAVLKKGEYCIAISCTEIAVKCIAV